MPAIRPGTKGGVISGWGTALPEKVLTNHELAEMMDTSDEWIQTRTGIRERRIGGSTIGLSVESGRQALEMSGLDPLRIDGLVLATTTPDKQWGNAAAVQNELGMRCGAFDVNSACSGFVYGLVTGHQFVAGGTQRVLVIGSETLSRITDWDDRSTAVLFADGAGAIVMDATDDEPSILAWDLGCDGSFRTILDADIGGYLHMEGREVFRRAVRVMIDSSQRTMRAAGVTPDEIALVVPHQANVRIIEAANQKLGFPMERTALVMETTGNTSSASIPLALADAAAAGRLKAGDLVLLVGFGAGMTWASALLRWSRD